MFKKSSNIAEILFILKPSPTSLDVTSFYTFWKPYQDGTLGLTKRISAQAGPCPLQYWLVFSAEGLLRAGMAPEFS